MICPAESGSSANLTVWGSRMCTKKVPQSPASQCMICQMYEAIDLGSREYPGSRLVSAQSTCDYIRKCQLLRPEPLRLLA